MSAHSIKLKQQYLKTVNDFRKAIQNVRDLETYLKIAFYLGKEDVEIIKNSIQNEEINVENLREMCFKIYHEYDSNLR